MARHLHAILIAAAAVWPAGGAAAQAEALRARAAPLAEKDARVYEEALAALEAAAGADDRENWQIGRALALAAEPPLEIATLACDVAQLAAEVSHHTNHQVRPDALAAASLAAACARGAAGLVEVNLTATPDDPRVLRARSLAADAAAAADAARPLQAAEPPAAERASRPRRPRAR
jgi:formiminotetrahydrofolate cyclodeaminase